MKTPILEEFKLKAIDKEEIKLAMKTYRVGHQPLYLDASKLQRDRLIKLLGLLSNVLEEENLSPKFPYPFYIISDIEDIWTRFPIFKSLEDLPKYYQFEAARPTNKEQKILDFIDISASNIRNEDVQLCLDEFGRTISSQRIIKALAKEGSKLEKIISIMEDENVRR
ncbi:hypothetical protein ACRXCV_11730 [Halobacteriovorax sp. GFR7]|uniref:hypothetical protein n=1 Tax=unclassified Halobacteriovorax TaxID=2639665 RepID=UPI00371E4298